MCLALVALGAHPGYALVIAANRDELHARPAEPARWWRDGWLAGRDASAGGTWLGVTRSGRWALLTNIRNPSRNDPQAPSRGMLVTRFLANTEAPAESLRTIVAESYHYNGYNLLAGEATEAYWGSNRAEAPQQVTPGIHGLSNQSLDTPWPKVERSKAALSAWCANAANGGRSVEPLFEILRNDGRAPDAELPATGVPLDLERVLSAPFIVSENYGTRCSTVLTIDRSGIARFVERSFDATGKPVGDVDYRFGTTAPR